MIDKSWYDNINKSKLTPPGYIFGIVWPILYIMLGISFFKVIGNKKCVGLCKPLIYFILQMILNLSWTTIFFKYKKTNLALIIIILIIGLTYKSYLEIKNIDSFASNLLIPYLLWLIFAMYLNLYIVKNN